MLNYIGQKIFELSISRNTTVGNMIINQSMCSLLSEWKCRLVKCVGFYAIGVKQNSIAIKYE